MRRYLLFLISVSIFTGLSGSAASAAQEQSAEERIQTLSNRIEALENRQENLVPVADWMKNLTISGLLEAEAGYAKYHPAAAGEPDEEASDIVLSTMELGFDAAFHPLVSGHILLLWEEDETEPVDLDEGFISVSGGEDFPVYANAGKFYLPFGYFETFFITDPLTLDLGETNESAVLLGGRTAVFDVSAGVFNGDADEAGDADQINDFFGSALLTVPETVLPAVELAAGVSYISDIADSDLLTDTIGAAEGPSDRVGGVSAHVFANWADRLFFTAEYVGALDTFAAGEFAFADGPVKPRAWNTELAWVWPSECGLAVKYEGSDDGGELLAETRYGAIAFCHPFAGVYLGLEYLWEAFENSDELQTVTAQLAYEF